MIELNTVEIKNIQASKFKKTKVVCDSINEYMKEFFESSSLEGKEDFLNAWKNIEHQVKLNNYIKEKNMKMKLITKEEELKIKKEKVTNRIKKIKEKKQAKVESKKELPKSAYFFFKNNFKKDNPTLDTKTLHTEAQKEWQNIKKIPEKNKYYKELADAHNSKKSS